MIAATPQARPMPTSPCCWKAPFPTSAAGVSSWINQIIRAYPQYRFAIVFLGSRRQDYGAFRYPLPENVVHFEEHFLYEDVQRGTHSQPMARQGDRAGLGPGPATC